MIYKLQYQWRPGQTWYLEQMWCSGSERQRLQQKKCGLQRRCGQRALHPHQAGRRRSSTCIINMAAPTWTAGSALLHQGFLLKRSGSSLNKEWKKKYVTLSSDGILSYHSSVNVSPHTAALTLLADAQLLSCSAALCLHRRTTCSTARGRRWTCCAWPSRCRGSGRLEPCRPAAHREASTGGSRTCRDLRVWVQVGGQTCLQSELLLKMRGVSSL